MQLSLFKALQSIKIDDDKATEVVEALEGYVTMTVQEATKPILTKLDSIEESNKARFAALQWTIGILGFIIAAASLFSGLSRFFFH